MPGSKKFGWILATWATLAAQLASAAVCRSCDLSCCVAAATSDTQPVGGCPLCAAAAESISHCAGDSANDPCRCQLDARQEQPASPPRSVSSAVDQTGQTSGLWVASVEPPPVLAVSREYLAASLSVPIRPPRILFGVWRN